MYYLLHMIMMLFGALSAGIKTYFYVGQVDMLLRLHFATPCQWVVSNSVSTWKYVLQFGLLPFPSKMIELIALPFPV